VGKGWVALSMNSEEYPPRKDYERIANKSLYSTTCLYLAVMYVTMQPYEECQRMQTFLPRWSVKRQVRSQ